VPVRRPTDQLLPLVRRSDLSPRQSHASSPTCARRAAQHGGSPSSGSQHDHRRWRRGRDVTRWLAAPSTTANTELLGTTMPSANTHNDASAHTGLSALSRITSMVGGHAWQTLSDAVAAFVSPAADQPSASHPRVPRTPPAVSRHPLPRPPRPRQGPRRARRTDARQPLRPSRPETGKESPQ
jgi:hypothetical protein